MLNNAASKIAENGLLAGIVCGLEDRKKNIEGACFVLGCRHTVII